MAATQQLVVRFLNVGQGDATHIVCPNGQHMLIDTNLDAKNGGIDVIAYLADELPNGQGDKKKLDYLVITHPHTDHIRGVGQIGNQFEIGTMWHSGHALDCEEGENEPYDKYLAVIKDLGDDAVEVCAGSDVWETIGDVTVHIYRPSAYVKNKKDQSASEKREAIHNECMVLKITYKGVSIMFAGDSHKGAWESIVKHYDAKDLKSYALHASHHGSRTFFKTKKVDDEAWTGHLDVIEPDYVIVSVGGDNEHDHPHADMMKEYRSRVGEEALYRTDDDLTIELRVDAAGKQSWACDPEGLQAKYELKKQDESSANSGASKLEKTCDLATPIAQPLAPPAAASGDDIPQIDTLAHRKPPRWPIKERYRCEVTHQEFLASGAGKPRFMSWSRLPKRARIEFRANTETPPPYTVYWQVTNTGVEARQSGDLRGDFYAGSGLYGESRTESTKYNGTHVVQAFVVKDGIVVARSPELAVRIDRA